MSKAARRLKKTLACIVTAVLIWVTGFVALVPAFADGGTNFDNTAVLDDLSDLDLTEFPANASGDPAFLRFVEYCYSDDPTLRNNYGIYVYIYNPSRKTFSARDGANELNVATGYGEDGEPSGYEILPLKLCGSSTGLYSKLFYKFRLVDASKLLANAAAQSKAGGERRYDIAGVYLWEEGQANSEAYGISKTYYCSGFAKGYAAESADASTLSCRSVSLETVDFTVYHTNYRMAEEYKEYTRQDLNSVYFAVPQRFFDEDGALQKIKAQWYEYRTNPVFVTSDMDAYAALEAYIGVEIGEKEDDLDWRVLWEEEFSSITNSYYFNKYYNRIEGSSLPSVILSGDYLSRFDWLMDTDGKGYEDYVIPRERAIGYINSYTENHPLQEKVQGKYAANLFADTIDEDRIELLENPADGRGKIVREVDAGEKVDLWEYKDQTFWQKFWGKTPESEVSQTVDPIVTVSAADIDGLSQTVFCEKYLINTDDYEDFKAFCKTAYSKTGDNAERVVLFRFATTDYYSSAARFDKVANIFDDGYTLSTPDGYVAQETVFLDFTVISLTFRLGEKETVIAAVASPIDIINGFDPPTSGLPFETEKTGLGCSGVKSIFSLILLALGIYVIWKAVAWVIDNLFARKK